MTTEGGIPFRLANSTVAMVLDAFESKDYIIENVHFSSVPRFRDRVSAAAVFHF